MAKDNDEYLDELKALKRTRCRYHEVAEKRLDKEIKRLVNRKRKRRERR